MISSETPHLISIMTAGILALWIKKNGEGRRSSVDGELVQSRILYRGMLRSMLPLQPGYSHVFPSNIVAFLPPIHTPSGTSSFTTAFLPNVLPQTTAPPPSLVLSPAFSSRSVLEQGVLQPSYVEGVEATLEDCRTHVIDLLQVQRAADDDLR